MEGRFLCCLRLGSHSLSGVTAQPLCTESQQAEEVGQIHESFSFAPLGISRGGAVHRPACQAGYGGVPLHPLAAETLSEYPIHTTEPALSSPRATESNTDWSEGVGVR